jgi:hypothetical protein
LKAAADGMFAEDFAGRILSFGAAAASRYTEIMLARRRVGKPIEGYDGLIAAIVLAAGATVATRDVGGFRTAASPLSILGQHNDGEETRPRPARCAAPQAWKEGIDSGDAGEIDSPR